MWFTKIILVSNDVHTCVYTNICIFLEKKKCKTIETPRRQNFSAPKSRRQIIGAKKSAPKRPHRDVGTKTPWRQNISAIKSLGTKTSAQKLRCQNIGAKTSAPKSHRLWNGSAVVMGDRPPTLPTGWTHFRSPVAWHQYNTLWGTYYICHNTY